MSKAALASSIFFAFVLGVVPLAQELRWRSGGVLGQPAGARATQGELLQRLAQGAERHVLVRFEKSPSPHVRELWRAAGVELGDALGGGAYFARVAPAALDSAAAARLAGLADVREIELDWKLHPTLAAGETPPWTVVARDERGETTVAVYLLLHPDVVLERGDLLLQALGGSTFDVLESVNGLVALVPRSRIAELAAADEVAWVEPALPQLEGVSVPGFALAPLNDSNRARVQADLLQTAPYDLDGSGVNVLVYDGGTGRATHVDFGGRLTARDASGTLGHSTHVAATIGGDGTASGGTFRGMAPAVTIQAYGFSWDGQGLLFFTNLGDFEADYDEAINVHGVDISNNSVGTNVEPSGFHCSIQGDYGVFCNMIDSVVTGSLGSPFKVVWAAGNERQQADCNIEGFGDYYSIAPPVTAKNHISVGAINSDDDSMTTFSSWGPTDDGRLKPDVCAPGDQVGGDGGVTSAGAANNMAYVTLSGTSFAAPTVCGLAALLLEDWRAQFGAPDPLNSTLKALFAHTAADLGRAGPDYQFGYGSVRGKDAVDFMRLGQSYEESLDESGSCLRWSMRVGTPASSPVSRPRPGSTPAQLEAIRMPAELRLTLAWDDAPGQPGVLGSLVNDLDLVVRDPQGAQRHVWTLNPENPSAAAVRTAADHVNNLEQVFVERPVPGLWSVEVRAHDLPSGPQSFSLVSSHALTPEPHLSISFPGALPTVLAPGVGSSLTARIVGVNDSLIGGTPTLHLRHDGGAFLGFPMTALGGDLYRAELPPAACSATPEFYLSAAGLESGVATSPAGAPGEVYAAFVTTLTTVFADDFSTDKGWTVTNVALTAGAWERGTPIGGGIRGDPLTAWGGSGLCYLTGNAPGDSDVDGGPTRLTSPAIDLSASGSFEISYARWLAKNEVDDDSLRVIVSNNDGATFTTVEVVTDGSAGWVRSSFLVEDFVMPTNQVRVRFTTIDNPSNSQTEAAIDDFRVVRRECVLPDARKKTRQSP